jgi:hypothetical protein
MALFITLVSLESTQKPLNHPRQSKPPYNPTPKNKIQKGAKFFAADFS